MTEEPQPCFHLDKAYVMHAASCQPFRTRAAREEKGNFGVAAGVSIAHLGNRFEAENPAAGGKQPGPGESAALLGGGAAPPTADARSPPGGAARRSPLSAPAFPSKGRRPQRRHRPHRLASRYAAGSQKASLGRGAASPLSAYPAAPARLRLPRPRPVSGTPKCDRVGTGDSLSLPGGAAVGGRRRVRPGPVQQRRGIAAGRGAAAGAPVRGCGGSGRAGGRGEGGRDGRMDGEAHTRAAPGMRSAGPPRRQPPLPPHPPAEKAAVPPPRLQPSSSFCCCRYCCWKYFPISSSERGTLKGRAGCGPTPGRPARPALPCPARGSPQPCPACPQLCQFPVPQPRLPCSLPEQVRPHLHPAE